MAREADFSETTKLEVRTKAGFHCCMCPEHELAFHVHHIKPVKDDGKNDMDNAVALCPNCHTKYGNNPDHRKIMRQARDWWYEMVAQKYHGENADKLNTFMDMVVRAGQGDTDVLDNIKGAAILLSTDAINRATSSDTDSLATSVIGLSTGIVLAEGVRLGAGVHMAGAASVVGPEKVTVMYCKTCGKLTNFLVDDMCIDCRSKST